jgi:hypothetical protein
MRNEKRCPRCGAEDVVKIVYGLPTRVTMEDLYAGKVALGGCMISPDSPDYVCDSCGHEWRGPGPMPPPPRSG